MIDRPHHYDTLLHLLKSYPIVAILGARQVGKTTLARQLAADRKGPVTFFDLEDPVDLTRLGEPALVLRDLEGLVVLDEIQRLPELFPILRVLADRPGLPARFLVLGSTSPDLLRQSSESLAGRIAYYELPGFTLLEVGEERLQELWLRGGFPRSFLAATDADSSLWRRNFIQTFLERDLPQLGIQIPTPSLRRFWSMLAHYHGQVWNGAELARALAVSGATVRRYLDLFTAALVVRQLQPWHQNLSKRQVRSPKVYVADSGLLHSLLGLETHFDLVGHPKVGASWEGFGLTEVVQRLGARSEECFFWATQGGAELDLLIVRGRRRLGFELKLTEIPKVSRSMHTVLSDLKLDRLDVIHAGQHTFPLADGIRAVALARIGKDLEAL